MSPSPISAGRIIQSVEERFHRWQAARHYDKMPVSQLFSNVYQSKAWGSREDRPFCSGDGSVREDAVQPYCEKVRDFIQSNKIETVVDVGCGDFAIGSRLAGPDMHYIGVDVVPELIQYNRDHFGSKDIEFHCLNLIEDELPKADLCLVRQVLQHLSNDQIGKSLTSLSRYRFAIITEHVYSGEGLRPNRDKPQGPGTRIPRRSGVFLDAPPFNLKVTPLLEVQVAPQEILRTVIINKIDSDN
jgi:SAM-dependent methyltransferase